MITAVGPFFLANEVWLIAFAGVLIAAFPIVEGRILTGFHPVVIALLVAWLVRDASMWFRARRVSGRWRAGWDRVLTAASAAFAAAAGILLGGVARGIPPEGAGPGSPTPYALLCGATVLTVFALHGAAFTAARTTGEPRERSHRCVSRLVPPAVVLYAATSGWTAATAAAPVPVIAFGVTGTGGVLLAWLATRGGHDGRAFSATVVATVSLPLMLGVVQVPVLLDGAAGPDALLRLTVLVMPVIPLVVGAQAVLWWLFRHRVDERSVTFF